MLKQLFRPKNLNDILKEAEEPTHSLKKALGASNLIMLDIVV